jgi:hypothetical protein
MLLNGILLARVSCARYRDTPRRRLGPKLIWNARHGAYLLPTPLFNATRVLSIKYIR